MAAKPPTSTRRRLSAEQRRAGLLDSAVAVFARRGYHQSSLDDIAGEAGVSKALIYEHFSSKQELYAELLEHHASELFERLAVAAAVDQGAAGQRLERGLDAFFGFVEDHRPAWRMLFRDTADPEVGPALERIFAQVTTLVAVLIAEDPEAAPRDDDQAAHEQAIAMLAQMLVGAVQALGNWWVDHREVPRARVVELAMDFIWLGLQRLAGGERWLLPTA
jgi:AcrR family transcriptional regulator